MGVESRPDRYRPPGQPGGRAPAPGRLALVQALLNTNDIEAGADALATVPDANRWLVETGLLGPDHVLTDRDLSRLRAAREAIRDLALANNGIALSRRAEARVAQIAARTRARADVEDGEVRFIADAGGVDGAIATLLLAIAGATADGTFRRLRACERDTCRWVFYDHSKNARSRWCAAAICGNRTYTHAYRKRKARARA